MGNTNNLLLEVLKDADFHINESAFKACCSINKVYRWIFLSVFSKSIKFVSLFLIKYSVVKIVIVSPLPNLEGLVNGKLSLLALSK